MKSVTKNESTRQGATWNRHQGDGHETKETLKLEDGARGWTETGTNDCEGVGGYGRGWGMYLTPVERCVWGRGGVEGDGDGEWKRLQ